MDKQPLVSIIIPTYNRADLIGETLDSVIAQTYPNWECIVVDDGSTDNTEVILEEYIQKDKRISYYRRPKNYRPGGNGARNYGFDISKGEYINWFDSDDVMLENFILEKIQNRKKYDCIICSHYTTDSDLKIIKSHFLSIKINILYDYLVWGEEFDIVTNNILFLKKFLTKNNLKFNEDILRGQETEFLLRIFTQNNNLKHKIINQRLFYYRNHINSKSEQNRNKIKKFNYSLIYVSFQKLNISKTYRFTDITNQIRLNLQFLSHKIIKERDFKSQILIFKNLIKTLNFRNSLFAFSLMIMYLINKTPKIILNKWKHI